ARRRASGAGPSRPTRRRGRRRPQSRATCSPASDRGRRGGPARRRRGVGSWQPSSLGRTKKPRWSGEDQRGRKKEVVREGACNPPPSAYCPSRARRVKAKAPPARSRKRRLGLDTSHGGAILPRSLAQTSNRRGEDRRPHAGGGAATPFKRGRRCGSPK